jgi:hypothetical protein
MRWRYATFFAFAFAGVGLFASQDCVSCHRDTAGHGNHPSGVVYDRAQGDSLKRSNEASGFGSTIARDLLVDGRVECASCHVPHSASESRFLLRTPAVEDESPQRASTALCTACHVVR